MKLEYPCDHCGEQAVCDGRTCAGWEKWFRKSWADAVKQLRELTGKEN